MLAFADATTTTRCYARARPVTSRARRSCSMRHHEHLLLMLHAKAGPVAPARWSRRRCRPTSAAVALREATEETGIDGLRLVRPAIDLDIHMFRPREGAPHIHLDVRYLVLAPPRRRSGGQRRVRRAPLGHARRTADLRGGRGLAALGDRAFTLADVAQLTSFGVRHDGMSLISAKRSTATVI